MPRDKITFCFFNSPLGDMIAGATTDGASFLEWTDRGGIDRILKRVEKRLGRQGLDNLHLHVSGIEYTDRGERKHLDLRQSDFNYVDLLQALKDFDAKGRVICESPSLEGDAILLKETYMAMS